MNFPFFLKAVGVSLIVAVIMFFISGVLSFDSNGAAIGAFIGTLIGFFISTQSTEVSGDPGTTDDIKTLYVGNLPYRANEAAVRHLFAEHGYVHSVRLMKDKNTGKRRGFGFVEISAKDSDKAISALNDTEFQQRTLKVREAKERPEKSDD
ncbi:RNA-binding protein [Thalassotalea sp. LPB0316]|uniref:RNA recognition motif domain-containing protein n=1 Tax=Thalassotalea sp. LPB0316 TaxID=2769490 RepID=UPI001865F922|nr:RNA-binding protein [Thalassotalea sp. LPB0316]QOL26025.1 RNA-binding protein [Thalassotalea sp. LPB0316]